MRRKVASVAFLAVILSTVFLTVSVVRGDEPVVCVVYFTYTGCSSCDRVKPLVINDLPRQYSGRFMVVEYEIYQPGNIEVLRSYDATYGCGVTPPLIIFGSDDFLVGPDEIFNNLRTEVEEHLNLGGNELPLMNGSSVAFEDLKVKDLPGTSTIWFISKNPPSDVPTFLAIVTAAAVDSVNPCEFAVLVILLSGVTASEGRKKALKTGLAFVLAVFVMYLLMGFGILQISTTLIFIGLPYYFRKAIGIFAIVVGVLNMKDYFWESARGVLSSVPESWRPRVQRLLDNITSIPGALFSGFLVSLFLLPCTSAPYFIVLSLLNYEATKISAVMLLLLYNLIFILPMIGIVLAVYFGLTTTAKAAHWRHKRIGLLHLIAGVIMFGMGIWMLFFY